MLSQEASGAKATPFEMSQAQRQSPRRGWTIGKGQRSEGASRRRGGRGKCGRNEATPAPSPPKGLKRHPTTLPRPNGQSARADKGIGFAGWRGREIRNRRGLSKAGGVRSSVAASLPFATPKIARCRPTTKRSRVSGANAVSVQERSRRDNLRAKAIRPKEGCANAGWLTGQGGWLRREGVAALSFTCSRR